MIRGRGVLLPLLLWALLSGGASAQGGAPEAAAAQVQNLLDWLGFNAACAQLPQSVERAIEARGLAEALSGEQLAVLRERLQVGESGAGPCARLAEHLLNRYDADAFNAAENTLDTELAARIRAYDLGAADAIDYGNVQEYLAQLAQRPPLASRRQLMAELVTAARLAELAALVQTEVEETVVALAAGLQGRQPPASDPAERAYRLQQREQYLAERAAALHLFSYRYLQGAELERYLTALQQAEVQWVLELGVAGMETALAEQRRNALSGE